MPLLSGSPVVGNTRYSLPEVWAQINVPASQTDVALAGQLSTNFDTLRMVRTGSIVGISVRFTASITAGTATITITKNGVATSLQLVCTSTSNTTGGQGNQLAGVDNFVAGDTIGVIITTTGTYAPTTNDVEVWVQVEEVGSSTSGTAASGTVQITNGNPASTVNLTTTGTLDWLLIAGGGNPSAQSTTPSGHRSRTNGGWLRDRFLWLGDGSRSGSQATYTATTTFSATAADDAYGVGFSSATGVYQPAFSGNLNIGFRVVVPATTGSRVLKLYWQITQGTATITAALSDGSASAALQHSSTPTSHSETSIVFQAAAPCDLVVTVLLTTNSGASCSLGFIAASLAALSSPMSGLASIAYKGTWASGYYHAGAVVRRGPFTFGAVQSTTVDPCDHSNVGSAADWTITGNGSQLQSGNVARLTNGGTSQQGTIYRNATMPTWHKKRIICDALVGPNGGADGLFIGVYDATQNLTPAVFLSNASFYGIFVDIYNTNNQSAVGNVAAGTTANRITLTTGSQISGNEILETSRYYRYYLDMEESGANWILTLYRDAYDSATTAGIDASGFLGTWTVTKPPFTTCRMAVSAFTGGIAGTFKVRSCWLIDRSGVWDMLAMFPHPPRIDTSIF